MKIPQEIDRILELGEAISAITCGPKTGMPMVELRLRLLNSQCSKPT